MACSRSLYIALCFMSWDWRQGAVSKPCMCILPPPPIRVILISDMSNASFHGQHLYSVFLWLSTILFLYVETKMTEAILYMPHDVRALYSLHPESSVIH